MRNTLIAGLILALAAALTLAACDDGDSTSDSPGKPTAVSNGAPTAIAQGSGEPSLITTTLGFGSVEPGADGEYTVTITAFGVDEPGIGAWTFNVRYDGTALSVVDCPSEGTQVCNPEFEPGALRFAGANAEGLQGDAVLGTIVFRCESSGTTPVTIEPELLADATIGDPRDIESVEIAPGNEIDCP